MISAPASGTGLVAALLLASAPAAAQDGPSLQRVAPTTLGELVVSRGERVGFAAQATSPAGGLHGTEWYLDGSFLGAQHRSSLPGSTEHDATFWRGINFSSPGNFLVEAEAFTLTGQYSAPVSWAVQVVERPRLLYVN